MKLFSLKELCDRWMTRDNSTVEHYPQCWFDGPTHYECARNRIIRLEASLAATSRAIARMPERHTTHERGYEVTPPTGKVPE